MRLWNKSIEGQGMGRKRLSIAPAYKKIITHYMPTRRVVATKSKQGDWNVNQIPAWGRDGSVALRYPARNENSGL